MTTRPSRTVLFLSAVSLLGLAASFHVASALTNGAWTPAGWIGIGTSNPSTPLQVTGTSTFATTGGNVGIGTTNPGNLLSVNGTSQASKFLGGSTTEVLNSTFTMELHRTGNATIALLDDQVAGVGDGGAIRMYAKDNGGNYRNNASFFGLVSTTNATSPGMYLRFDTTAAGGSSTERMRVDENGNVGIGTTNPKVKLDINSNGGQSYPVLNQSNPATGSLRLDNSNQADLYLGIGVGPSYAPWIQAQDSVSGGTYALAIQPIGGNVGIGTTAPGYKLDVSGTGNFTQPVVVGTPTANSHAATKSYVDSSISSGSVTNAQNCSAGAVCGMNGANLNAGNITGVNKLTVVIIDPVYAINGARYATYLPATTGVKEETTGIARLTRSADGTYRYAIQFTTEPVGSDLWLFAHATNMKEHLADLAITETPAFNGTVWYEKDPTHNRLTLMAKPNDGSTGTALEVSYRLIAPRFDASAWPNTSHDQTPAVLAPPPQ